MSISDNYRRIAAGDDMIDRTSNTPYASVNHHRITDVDRLESLETT